MMNNRKLAKRGPNSCNYIEFKKVFSVPHQRRKYQSLTSDLNDQSSAPASPTDFLCDLWCVIVVICASGCQFVNGIIALSSFVAVMIDVFAGSALGFAGEEEKQEQSL